MARGGDPFLSPDEVLERFTGGPKTGVFTDGSCEGNPGPGGYGWVWVEDDEIVDSGYGYDPQTTNNRMELAALIAAYRKIPQNDALTIYSDSKLCVDTLTKWAAGWERRGWKRKGGPIANLELVRDGYSLAQAHPNVALQWIRAHDGARWNEYADALATTYLRAR
jgi:ribonuclease HI